MRDRRVPELPDGLDIGTSAAYQTEATTFDLCVQDDSNLASLVLVDAHGCYCGHEH